MTEKISKTKKRKAHLLLYFYMILILLLVTTVSTYTWFSLSKTPRVSDMSIYISVMNGLEFSLTPDGDDWEKQLSFADMVSETPILRPVTWSDANNRFFAAVYGMDGRQNGEWMPLSDERNANRSDDDGYYCIATFYATSDDTMKVSLTPAVEVTEGKQGAGTYLVGTPLWNDETISHDNGGKGAENALRIGIQITRLRPSGFPTGEPPMFYIYEPNADRHNDGSWGLVNTPSIDGTETLISPDRIIAQTASDWAEADPIQQNVQMYSLGEFISDPYLFLIHEDETVMIRLYLWLEGQDVDCVNAIADAKITANIQFLAVSDNESGWEPVDPEEDDDKDDKDDKDDDEENDEEFDNENND